MTTEPTPLTRGSLVYDPATGKVGEYQDLTGRHAMLRPVGGGREWEADPASLRRATPDERLSAGLRAASSQTRTAAALTDPAELDCPPQPVDGCAACGWLADRREEARAVYDHSAEADANVLLRHHQRREHHA
ncbi:hypothetical protein [Streptomyces sp. NPDC001978]|uniref:hypothetical protein n=1 Tax=Streptomyces sp. NPDC001978 TaxID=3364627 RepID=UPI0036BD2BBD